MNKRAAISCLIMLMLVAAVVLAACYQAATATAVVEDAYEIKADERTTIKVQSYTYNGWRSPDTVVAVKWTYNGALLTITYESGRQEITAAQNYLVEVTYRDN